MRLFRIESFKGAIKQENIVGKRLTLNRWALEVSKKDKVVKTLVTNERKLSPINAQLALIVFDSSLDA